MTQPAPTPVIDSPERLRAKEIHHRVMIIMGACTVAIGLWAAYLSMTKGDLPAIMYGRWRMPAPESRFLRRARPELVKWDDWSADILLRAKKSDRLILLNISASWSLASHLMREGTYSDPKVAAFIERATIPVRIDAEENPGLARRYSGGRPTNALLIPSGEILAAGAYMTPEQFLPWARTLELSYRSRRANVAEAAAQAQDERLAAWATRGETSPRPSPALTRKSPGFRSFARLSWLLELGDPASEELSRKEWVAALALQDPVWGGFQGSGHEKLLIDQADALRAAARLNPAQARRVMAYVGAHLWDFSGGFFSSESGEVARLDGMVVEGDYYFALTDSRRRSFGLPQLDRRVFAASNARMIRAILDSSGVLSSADEVMALKALERYWKDGVKNGVVSHRLGGKSAGLLEDQVAFARACLAAFAATQDPKHLKRARAVLAAAEGALADPGSPALFDGPPVAGLPQGLERILPVDVNAELLSLYQENPGLRSSGERAKALFPWIVARSGQLDPALWALLAARQSAVIGQ